MSTHRASQVTSGKESIGQCRRCKRHGFSLWVGKIPWRREWQPTPVFLPGESHGQKSLEGYGPWGRKESDTTEAIYHSVQPGVVLSVSWRPRDTGVSGPDPRTPTQWPGASVGPAPQSTLGQRPPPWPRDVGLPEGTGPVAQRAALSFVHHALWRAPGGPTGIAQGLVTLPHQLMRCLVGWRWGDRNPRLCFVLKRGNRP